MNQRFTRRFPINLLLDQVPKRGPRYFDFLRFRKHDHTICIIHVNWELMNIHILLLIFYNVYDEYYFFFYSVIYSTNSID